MAEAATNISSSATAHYLVARKIDEISKTRENQQLDENLLSPKRKFEYKPDIEPDDDAWQAKRAYFRDRLQKVSVQTVLDEDLEEAQTLYIQPPMINGEILVVQNEHTKDYQAALSKSGRFHGIPDNLATKFTMLHFGLPVAPLTLNNILRCSKPEDDDDPEDPPEDLPKYQRIMYAEKPLEFLDEYHERSHGYPILRRKAPVHRKPPTTPPISKGQNPSVGSSGQRSKAPTNSPILPGSPTVGIRGGAGSPGELNKFPSDTIVYGPQHRSQELTINSADQFLGVASKLLGFDKHRDFSFQVALYRNDEESKRSRIKHLYRVHLMNSDVFERKYIDTISRALTNPDLIVVVRPGREQVASNFDIGELSSESSEEPPRKTVTFQSTQSTSAAKTPPTKSPKQTTSSNTSQTSQPTAKTSTVYGYSGRLTVRSDQIFSPQSFLAVALRLLGRPNNDQSWPSFHIVILSIGDDAMEALHVVNRENIAELDKIFVSIRDIFRQPETKIIFIGPSGYAYPQNIREITPDTSEVCELTLPEVGTAYWKIPPTLLRSSKELPAINQLQPGFSHAMQFLFQEFPFGEVKIEGASIGYGGFELTWNTWVKLRDRYQKTSGMLKFNVSFTAGDENRGLLRQIGSSLAISYDPKNIIEVFDEILHALKQNNGGAMPDNIQFWGKPTDRNAAPRTSGMFIPLIKDLAISYLKAALEGSGKSRIAHFRPVWKDFSVTLAGDSTSTHQWKQSLSHGSLVSFRAQLKQSFPEKGFEDTTSFIISEVGDKLTPDQEKREFFVSKETTELEWRLNVFTWLSSQTLEVKIADNNPHVLNSRIPWGLFFANNFNSATGAPLSQQKPANPGLGKGGNSTESSSSQPILPQTQQTQTKATQPISPQTQQITSKSPQPNKSSPLVSGIFQNTAPKPTRFNKPRYEADKAGQYPVQSYYDWNKEQRFQDKLHFSSYVKDQGVVEPGRAPAAPMYGESLQAPFKISSSLPTVYMSRETPTDIRQLREETQILRNSVLDREHMCRICSVTFRDYEKDQIAQHYSEHQARESLDGICIWCGTTQWAFMSTDAKQKHLREHLDKENTLKIKEFWEAHNCPVCNKGFKDMKPDDIVAHCINAHAPGTVQFCDKCGIKETGLIQAHRDHHEKVCRQSLDEPQGANRPDFCIRCGKNTTPQTPEEAQLHDRDCRTTGKFFCQLDGFDVTNFSTAALAAHSQDCRRPGGRRKMYCRKCGMKVEGIDQAAWKHHEETCWNKREPTPQNHNLTLKEIQQEKAKIAQANAVARSQEDLSRRRYQEFNRRENELREKERDFAKIQDSHHERVAQEEERLINREKALTAVQKGRLPDSSDLGPCPFDQCDVLVGPMTRKQLYNHLKHHFSKDRSGGFDAAVNSKYILCPLPNHDGTACNRRLEVSNDVDFGVHLVHGLSPADQRQSARKAAVYHAHTAKANKRLRDANRELEEELRKADEYLTSHNSQEGSKDVSSSTGFHRPIQDVTHTDSEEDDDSDLYGANDSPPPYGRATQIIPPTYKSTQSAPEPSPAAALGTKRKAQQTLTEAEKRLKTSNLNEQGEQGVEDLPTEHGENAEAIRRGRGRRGVHFDPTYRPRRGDLESLSSSGRSAVNEELSELVTDPASTQKGTGQETTISNDNGPTAPTAPTASKNSKNLAASVESPARKSTRKGTPTYKHKSRASTAKGGSPKGPAPKRAKIAQSSPPQKGKR